MTSLHNGLSGTHSPSEHSVYVLCNGRWVAPGTGSPWPKPCERTSIVPSGALALESRSDTP